MKKKEKCMESCFCMKKYCVPGTRSRSGSLQNGKKDTRSPIARPASPYEQTVRTPPCLSVVAWCAYKYNGLLMGAIACRARSSHRPWGTGKNEQRLDPPRALSRPRPPAAATLAHLNVHAHVSLVRLRATQRAHRRQQIVPPPLLGTSCRQGCRWGGFVRWFYSLQHQRGDRFVRAHVP